MQINVVKNARKNVVFGVINKIILLLCPFAERTVLQIILGEQYLGLGGLYSSIISVLSLSELGFSSVIVYNMYKPVADGDTGKVNALLAFYRKVYCFVGGVIISAGLLLIPFLPELISGSYPDGVDLTQIYLIYLGNTALSYFFYAYLTSILVVHQRNDITSVINSCVKIGLTGTQIAILFITGDYYLFSLLMPCFTLLGNLLIGWRVHALFPQYRPAGHLPAEDLKRIRRLAAGSFIQQSCAVTRNSLDSICASAFLGLAMTAIYNNYFVIIAGVTSMMYIIIASFTGGIGNHVATKSIEDNYREMKRLDFLYLWTGGWCMICMLCLYQPFMQLWMGDDMLLPMSDVVLLCIYFYLLKLGDVRYIYTSANGLWWEQRYRALGETLLNLILNITMGKILGITGIILATMISLFLCNYIWSVKITFRMYFSVSRRNDYYKYQMKQSIVTAFAAAVTYGVCRLIPSDRLFLHLVLGLAVCIVVPNVIYYAVYRKSDLFQYAKNRIFVHF
jgi:O-antigen/teichoic acid export membrane protein